MGVKAIGFAGSLLAPNSGQSCEMEQEEQSMHRPGVPPGSTATWVAASRYLQQERTGDVSPLFFGGEVILKDLGVEARLQAGLRSAQGTLSRLWKLV